MKYDRLYWPCDVKMFNCKPWLTSLFNVFFFFGFELQNATNLLKSKFFESSNKTTKRINVPLGCATLERIHMNKNAAIVAMERIYIECRWKCRQEGQQQQHKKKTRREKKCTRAQECQLIIVQRDEDENKHKDDTKRKKERKAKVRFHRTEWNMIRTRWHESNKTTNNRCCLPSFNVYR